MATKYLIIAFENADGFDRNFLYERFLVFSQKPCEDKGTGGSQEAIGRVLKEI